MESSKSEGPVVIVGAGHAGVQAAASLREEGYGGEIVLLSDERALPYQRPPLSKAFLKGEMDLLGLPLRAEAFYRDQRIDLRLGAHAIRIDRAAQTIALADGSSVGYGHLILATGARQRRLDVPGVDLAGVYALRNIADAAALRERIAPGLRVVVIGAGFIGLEVAATAAKLGAETAVVEIARPMGRAVSPVLSNFYTEAHRAFGARLFLGVGVREIRGTGKAEAVVLSDGEVLPADLVLVGVGVTAEDALARAAGIECGNGILVDERLVTSDPAISAIGDCAAFPNATLGYVTRLEVDPERGRPGQARRRPPRRQARSLRRARLVLERPGRPEAPDRRAVARRRRVGGARRPGDAGLFHVRLSQGEAGGGRIGQPRRRPRRRQAHPRHRQEPDPRAGRRPRLRHPGAGEGVAGASAAFSEI